MSEWTNAHDYPPPDGVVVETVISDQQGERNKALLKRSGRLWFLPSGDVYVYYTPTHWRTLSPRPPIMGEVERIAEARDVLIRHLRNTFGDEAADCREDSIERGLEDNDDFIVGYLAAQAMAARSGETGTGSTEGNSAVLQDAPTPQPTPPAEGGK